jgi:hypothetical protein
MESVKILESTDYKKLETDINKWIEYQEQNEDMFNGATDISLSTTKITDENKDDVIYYTALISYDVDVNNN